MGTIHKFKVSLYTGVGHKRGLIGEGYIRNSTSGELMVNLERQINTGKTITLGDGEGGVVMVRGNLVDSVSILNESYNETPETKVDTSAIPVKGWIDVPGREFYIAAGGEPPSHLLAVGEVTDFSGCDVAGIQGAVSDALLNVAAALVRGERILGLNTEEVPVGVKEYLDKLSQAIVMTNLVDRISKTKVSIGLDVTFGPCMISQEKKDIAIAKIKEIVKSFINSDECKRKNRNDLGSIDTTKLIESLATQMNDVTHMTITRLQYDNMAEIFNIDDNDIDITYCDYSRHGMRDHFTPVK